MNKSLLASACLLALSHGAFADDERYAALEHAQTPEQCAAWGQAIFDSQLQTSAFTGHQEAEFRRAVRSCKEALAEHPHGTRTAALPADTAVGMADKPQP